MENIFRSYIQSHLPLTDAEWSLVKERIRIREVKKGEIIQEKDKPGREMNFVLKGAIRSYIDKNGNDITWNFYFMNRIATDFQSFLTEEPSPLTFIAIDSSTILSMSKTDIEELYQTVPKLFHLEKIFAQYAFLDMRSRMESFLLQSAEERYLALMTNAPDLIKNLPNKDIATYLGIAPQSLSRIKARLYKKR